MTRRQSKKPVQLDLFQTIEIMPAADPLAGLLVQLPDRCAACDAQIAKVGKGAGPHKASLTCIDCNAHRGWMSSHAHGVLVSITEKFGCPKSPIVIRRGDMTHG
jgi:hypothetical protein